MQSAHIPCLAHRCIYCRRGDGVLPLTPVDLAWQFSEAEAALGIRSTHGSFVDMALIGPTTGNGGRTNGVENRAVQPHALNAVSRHRCIRSRLERSGATPADLDVLRVAYSPEDWVRAIGDPDLRHALEGMLRGVPVEVARVLPMTDAARAHAARRQAPAEASAEPVVVTGPRLTGEADASGNPLRDREAGVRCAYRPPPPAPKPKKARPSDPGRKVSETPAERLKKHLREQPGLAGSARGFVMHAALDEDRTRWRALVHDATALLALASRAALVRDPPRPARVRAVRHPLPDRAEVMFASEVA